ncbi:maltose acetyltransferase domain-containing protein [Lentisphaera marina]|uniref:maltose acetyltransferase domain-containing protein n=1 Tax=Lentisphaera marina TaxID=1111041 RepID=UPI0023670C18|nr:maltose acetyltransferase domain-containing protein [Lentisphaera marina]MDD7983435.1 maltose acetyltransferase domain-containing protein [Lentisphaera marina]
MNKEFDSSLPKLLKLITRARSLSNQYNQLAADNKDKLHEILTELLGSVTDDSYIDIPFYCDYGKNIHIGKNV